MTDLEILLSEFDTGAMMRPSANVPNLVDLSLAVASLAGADIAPSENSPALVEQIGEAEHLVFLMVDGFGMVLLEQMNKGAFLKSHLKTELRSVFPSATAVGLTSFATGEWPSKHGVTGWWTHIPDIEAAATVMQFVRRSNQKPLNSLGLKPEQVFPKPSIFGSIERDSLAMFPNGIDESVYSRYFCGNMARRGYASFREAMDFAAKRVKSAKAPTFTYIYTDRIDKEAHLCGVQRPEIRGAVTELDNAIRRLCESLDGRARVVVSADHGFLDAGEGFRHLIRTSDKLMPELRYPPSGDARVLYLHTHSGAEDNVREYFQRRFKDKFLLITPQEAEGIELFGPGPISRETRARIGNLIAISRNADAIEYRGSNGPGRVMHELSQHSGLSPDEMRIPLVVA